jgi:hypothetical protein
MARSEFSVSSALPVLARIPLLPADGPGPVAGADALLAEGMFLASRHIDRDVEQPAGHSAGHSGRPGGRGRLAATHRGYEIRAAQRPTPHGVFAGVALARFASPGEDPVVRLGDGHRVRTNPRAAWLAALRDRILTDVLAI